MILADIRHGYMTALVHLAMPNYILHVSQAFLQCHDIQTVRSRQVRSECLTCTYRASCCSAHLSWAQVLDFAGSSIWDRTKKGGGEGVKGDHLHWRVQGSTSSPTRVGSRWRVVWGVIEFGMSCRIKPKDKYVRISMKEGWRNLYGSSKNTEFMELHSDF